MQQNTLEGMGATSRGWAPIPGPVDRVTFAEELRRRRRKTWRYLALCAVAVAITGFPMSAIITPILFLVLVIVGRIVQAAFGLPSGALRPLAKVGRIGFNSLDYFIENLDRIPIRDLVLQHGDKFLPGFALLLLPGAVVCVLIWLALQGLMLRAGVGGALLALGAREPRTGDLEEHQLVNVVEEMAIAAGLPVPRVRLLDLSVPNAVAIGSSPQDAMVFVTRGLLDDFDRDETQGILGHLIGSIGNGDLRVGLGILAVFQTFGLIMTVVDVPYRAQARRALWQLLMLTLRLPFRRGARQDAEADLVGAMLTESLSADSADDADEVMEAPNRPGLNPVHRLLLRTRMFVLLPFLLASLLLKMQQFLFLAIVLGPALAMVWRTRRYVADATAVRLTRNPDALARGLVRLAHDGAMIPGAQWASHLFVVTGQATTGQAGRQMEAEADYLRERSARAAGMGQLTSSWGAAQSAAGRFTAANHGPLGDTDAVIIPFHPSLQSRLQRLAAMGATDAAALTRSGFRLTRMHVTLLFPLFLLIGGLLTIALGLAFGLALLVDEMVIAFGLGIGLALLGTSP